MKILSICNWKGGVGKTTTAVNLGYSLTKLNKSVLLVDADPQTNATVGLDFPLDELLDNDGLYHVLKQGIPLIDEVYQTEYENYYVVPATPLLSDLEIELSNKIQREEILNNCIKACRDELEENFDFIIIDNNPSLGLLTLNSLGASDYIIVPIDLGAYSLDGLSNLIDTVQIMKNVNSQLSVLGILLTKVDARTNLEKFFRENLSDIPWPVFNTKVSQNVDINRSQLENQPVLKYNKQAKSAKEYLQFAKEIMKEV